MKRKYTVIDLFAGCGGLSEGFLQTNMFEHLASIEWEKPMVDTLRKNLVERWNYSSEKANDTVIQFDLQKTEELLHGNWSLESIQQYGSNNSERIIKNGLDSIISQEVDVVIGGPPCQAYSLAGRAQDKKSMKEDYRNYLFESFAKIVDYYKPKLFVFENVPGILSAKPGDQFVIERIYEAFRKIGYEIRNPQSMKKSIYSSVDYQVPQDRKRVIIFGVRKDYKIYLEPLYEALTSLKSDLPCKTVKDALYFLPKFKPLDQPYKEKHKNMSHQLVGSTKIDLHEARYHNKRDIQIFKEWLTNHMNDCSNEEKIRFYKKMTGKDTHHNKYRNLEWDKPSPTIVSHLYKDGLMFIHPDIKQLRSITVREAGLLQTFPLDFSFVGSTAYCYKMIGNAVPVLFAKNIALAVANILEAIYEEK